MLFCEGHSEDDYISRHRPGAAGRVGLLTYCLAAVTEKHLAQCTLYICLFMMSMDCNIGRRKW